MPGNINNYVWIIYNYKYIAKCSNQSGCDVPVEKGKVEIFKKTGTEIGKKAAEKSGGLFSADDWHCSR